MVATATPERTGWTCTTDFGAGSIPTAGVEVTALDRHQLMAAADDGAVVGYAIDHRIAGQAEVGFGIYASATNTITRGTGDNLLYSTSGGSTVLFTPGEKQIRILPTGADLYQLLGHAVALTPATPTWDLDQTRSASLSTTTDAEITATNVAGKNGQIFTLSIQWTGTHEITFDSAVFDLLMSPENGGAGSITPMIFVMINDKLRPMVPYNRVSIRTRGRSGTSRVLTQDDDGDGPYAHDSGAYGDLATYFFREPAPPSPVMVLDSDQCRGSAKITLRNEYTSADLIVQRPGTAPGPNVTVPAGWVAQFSGKADASTSPGSAYWDKQLLVEDEATAAGGVASRVEVTADRDIVLGDRGAILCAAAPSGNLTFTLPRDVLSSDNDSPITIDNQMAAGQLAKIIQDVADGTPVVFQIDEDISATTVQGVEVKAGVAVTLYRQANNSGIIRVVGKCAETLVSDVLLRLEDLTDLTTEDDLALEIEG